MTTNEDTEPVMQDDQIQMMLRSTLQTLAYIPIEILRAYVQRKAHEEQMRDAIGPIIDPTGWRNDRQSGQADDNSFQLRIVKHLLSAYEEAIRREKFVQNLKVPPTLDAVLAAAREARQDSHDSD